MLRNEQRHEHVDIKKCHHGAALFRTVQEAVDIVDAEGWSAGPAGKYRYAALEVHARIGNAAEEGFYELVNLLASLPSQVSETSFQSRVKSDGRHRHTKELLSVPMLPQTSEAMPKVNRGYSIFAP
jgi:hypothetical protein